MSEQSMSMSALPMLSPLPRAALLQYMSLLPLDAADLDALVDRAVAENPALERPPGWTCGTCGRFCCESRCPACSITTRPADPAAPTGWRDELRSLARSELPQALFPHLDLVVDSLDERGFLTERAILDAEAGTALATVRDAIRRIGPPGVAAASPVDCVRLQAADLVARGVADAVLLEIVDAWLEVVAIGDYAQIAIALGASEKLVRESVDVLKACTRPFVALASAEPRAASVDVEFAASGDDLVATVVDSAWRGLRVSEDIDLSDAQARAWWAPHRQAAARLVAAVDARAHLLARVADALAVHQRSYLLHGHGHRPLRRAELAAQLGVHPSTVGRVVTGKVGRCPDGRLVPLAALFGTSRSILERVAAAVADAPTATDAALAAALGRAGTPIARRTVAKYRALVRGCGAKPASHPG